LKAVDATMCVSILLTSTLSFLEPSPGRGWIERTKRINEQVFGMAARFV
jgi:hypothetical protein